MQPILPAAILALLMIGGTPPNTVPEGFMALFNGRDLTGWQEHIPMGWNPVRGFDGTWTVKDGVLCYDGDRTGHNCKRSSNTATSSCGLTGRSRKKGLVTSACGETRSDTLGF